MQGLIDISINNLRRTEKLIQHIPTYVGSNNEVYCSHTYVQ